MESPCSGHQWVKSREKALVELKENVFALVYLFFLLIFIATLGMLELLTRLNKVKMHKMNLWNSVHLIPQGSLWIRCLSKREPHWIPDWQMCRYSTDCTTLHTPISVPGRCHLHVDKTLQISINSNNNNRKCKWRTFSLCHISNVSLSNWGFQKEADACRNEIWHTFHCQRTGSLYQKRICQSCVQTSARQPHVCSVTSNKVILRFQDVLVAKKFR